MRDPRNDRNLTVTEEDDETGSLRGVPRTLAAGASTASGGAMKARLVLLRGAQPGRRYPLDDHSSIGRGSSCTVQIEDAMASRRHALIQRLDATSWELIDLGSRNGTLLNGKPAGRDPVRFGDHIQIGETVFLFSHTDPLEERILHRQKLEAIGRLGAGIAHDINNVLGGILMNVDYVLGLGDRSVSDPEVHECLADLRAASLLGAELTRRILAVARRGAAEHVQIDLSTLVNDTLEIARRTFDRSVKVQRSIAPQVHVRGDRAHLQQMLMNLLLNARDAMPQGGTLTVTLGYARPSEVESEMVAVAGHHARLVVADTGIGMDASTRARIFEPFFTTKSADKGSGLGLATVMDVVTGHGGTIECHSQPSLGTSFRVVLPALMAAARTESRTPAGILRAPNLPRPTAKILVVDDEPLSRRSICRLLSRDGHLTLSAGDGREALEVFGREGQSIELVLMDLDMPELDGYGAMLEMRRRRPEVRVVFLTGFVTDVRKRELYEAGASVVLNKPCDAVTLREALALALSMSGNLSHSMIPTETR
ncbi:MAG: ATP-binding protein [Deltaproteobacteria bacterium]|jgi:signal transduction histidine kinase/ActR/RegA family two-component response regulator